MIQLCLIRLVSLISLLQFVALLVPVDLASSSQLLEKMVHLHQVHGQVIKVTYF